MRAYIPPLRNWEVEDLVQEAYLKAMVAIEKSFRGDCALKTFVIRVTKNHLLAMARSARIRTIDSDLTQAGPPVNVDVVKTLVLKEATKELLGWLKQNPGEIKSGWEVLNLLLWSHGDYDHVALALTVHTGSAWTPERVRSVVRRIKQTAQGRSLCESLGVN